MTTKNVYRNKPHFETNPMLNNDVTPDVPTFNSNAMDNQGLVPLNKSSNGYCHNHKKAHKGNSYHKNKGCHCDHK